MVHIEGKEITSINEFHKVFKEKLDFPSYYGENLDALWDMLTGWVELPITIVWSNYSYSKKSMGDISDKISSTLIEAEEELDGELKIIFK